MIQDPIEYYLRNPRGVPTVSKPLGNFGVQWLGNCGDVLAIFKENMATLQQLLQLLLAPR